MAEKFETVQWATGTNIYEVNLRQYTPAGTFQAFEKELPRLRNMGIEILWFMPLTPISAEKRQCTLGSYYACSNYTAINPEFGEASDFKKLVATAHDQGFKVIIDWVANHTGYDHTWTAEHPELYKKDVNGNFYDAYGWQDVIDLDYSKPELWNLMIAAMRFWISEFDIDGFRCDMAHLVPLGFWMEARAELDRHKKLFWLGECEVPEYHAVFDATYAWSLLHTMEAVYRKEATVQSLTTALEASAREYPENALRLSFTSNHDENSHSGSEYERFGEGAKAFAVLTLTWKNSLPLIYSGQEMPNKKRLKFFDKDEIEWTGEYFLHNFYQTLLSLRKNSKVYQTRAEQVAVTLVKTSAPDNIFAFSLKDGTAEEVLVILNLSPENVRFAITEDLAPGKFTSIFSGIETDIYTGKNFELLAWEYLVCTKNVD